MICEWNLPHRGDTGADMGVPLSQAEAWSLVLSARGVPHRLERAKQGWRILVPAFRLESAVWEIRCYEEENRVWPPKEDEAPPSQENTETTLWVLLVLMVFHGVTVGRLGANGEALRWLELGSANAGRILQGEWWRLVTALTLHADWLHVFSNVFIGGPFVILLCRQLGSGAGWGLVLLSGILGNFLNVLVHGPPKSSIGASTSVFAAIGLLAGLQAVRRRRFTFRDIALPVAAALALLSLLGSGGERTDLGAHLFGLFAGLALGASTGLLVTAFGIPSPSVNRWLAAVTASVPVLAWIVALIGET